MAEVEHHNLGRDAVVDRDAPTGISDVPLTVYVGASARSGGSKDRDRDDRPEHDLPPGARSPGLLGQDLTRLRVRTGGCSPYDGGLGWGPFVLSHGCPRRATPQGRGLGTGRR